MIFQYFSVMSSAPPSLSHGPIIFLIPQNGAKNHHNLKTSTIQGEN